MIKPPKTVNEKTRRAVNELFDTEPTFHHKFNLKISLPYIKNKKILDIGCWTGQFTKLAAKKAKEITGLDPNQQAVEFCRLHIKRGKFLVGIAEKLPFPNKSFDVVTFLDVIEHLPKGSENSALKQINQVLKPKGYLVLSTPSAHPLSILLDPAFFLIKHRHYSKNQITFLLKKAGFNIVKIYQTGNLTELFSNNFELLSKHLFKRKFIPPAFITQQIKKGYSENNGFAELHIIARKSS